MKITKIDMNKTGDGEITAIIHWENEDRSKHHGTFKGNREGLRDLLDYLIHFGAWPDDGEYTEDLSQPAPGL